MNSNGKSIAKIMGSILFILMISTSITAGASSCDNSVKSAIDCEQANCSFANCSLTNCSLVNCSFVNCSSTNCSSDLCGCVPIVDGKQNKDCNKECTSCSYESVTDCEQANCSLANCSLTNCSLANCSFVNCSSTNCSSDLCGCTSIEKNM